MDDVFALERRYADEIVAHALSEAPNECCGILAGINGAATKLYRTTNAEHSPYRYTVDPEDLIAVYKDITENGWELLAVYHSHTHTEAYPSPTDIESAFLPRTLYIIISVSEPDKAVVKGFRIAQNKITEVQLKIIDR